MKNKIWIIVFFMVTMEYVNAQHPTIDNNWQVVFEDDFSIFDTTRWRKEDGVRQSGLPDEDFGCYLPSNVTINSGQLKLAVIRDSIYHDGPCIYNNHQPGYHLYSSASVISQTTYLYGYFEIRAKLPISDGYWPSFWFWNNSLNPNVCWYNEVDVFEGQGYFPDSLYTNFHWDFSCPLDELHDAKESYCKDITNYHWYGLEWTSEWLRWYCDGDLVREERNTCGGVGIHHGMYMILSVSVAGSLQFLPNIVSGNTIFPNYMYVDQANVYQLHCDNNTVVVEIPNFATYQYGVKKSIKLSGATQLPVGATTCLRATDFIELTNGFEVPVGTGFFADVHACP